MSPLRFGIFVRNTYYLYCERLGKRGRFAPAFPSKRDEMPRNSNLKRREQPEDFEAPELMFAELDGLLGYHLRRAQGAMHRDFMAAVADFELDAEAGGDALADSGQSRRLAGRGGCRAGHGSRHHDGADGPARRSRLRHSQAFVDRPAPAGVVPDAVRAEHLAKVQDRGLPSTKRNSAPCSRLPNSLRWSTRSRSSKVSAESGAR